MANAEKFISLYKVLEDLLEEKCREEGRSTVNAVYQYISAMGNVRFRDKLDLCRQVRNLITHSADIDGCPPIEPSDGLMRALEEIVSYFQKPPLVLDRATAVDRLLVATPRDRVVWLMQRMARNGYSHVPVMENDRLTGVFSASTPFAMAMDDNRLAVDDQTRLDEVREALRPENHRMEQFCFIDPDTTCDEARKLFVRTSPRERRVAALFVTENGQPYGRLLGMLTPWDLMEES